MTAARDALVDVKWLAERIGESYLKILDCSWFLPQEMRDPLEEYEIAHIPGAIFLEWAACSSEESTETMLYLPTAEEFASVTGSLGIGNDDLVVAYDAEGMHSIAARAWWMFRVFGQNNVALLDGGLAAWKEAGLETETTVPETKPVNRAPATFNSQLVRDYHSMHDNLQSNADQMIDVRAEGRYLGTAASHDKRPGHIPGAINLPVIDCIDRDGHGLIPVEEMKNHFEQSGIDLGKPTVAYCGGGGSSPVVAFGAFLLGHTDMAIYDGAWEDWTHHPDSPVKKAS